VGNILERQREQGWPARAIDRLSADLQQRFPDARGFSPRNLRYMWVFAEAWPDLAILQRSVAPRRVIMWRSAKIS
jgi:hypothetical protein